MDNKELNLKDDFFADVTAFIADFRGYANEIKNYNKEGDAAKAALETLTGIASDVDLTEENISAAFDTKYEKTLEKIAETEIFLDSLKIPVSDDSDVANIRDAYGLVKRTIVNDEGLSATLNELTTCFVDEFSAIGNDYETVENAMAEGSMDPTHVRYHLDKLNDSYRAIKDEDVSLGSDAVKSTLAHVHKIIDKLEKEMEIDMLASRLTDDKSRQKYIKLALRR